MFSPHLHASSSSTLSSSASASTEGPVAVKLYCDRWSQALRGMAGETKNLTEALIKWLAYDQSTPDQRPGGQKWTNEEQDMLKQALTLYGDDMDKICEALPMRTEQAIRAAVKRKLDPKFWQQIGPLKKRSKAVELEDNSPLACYFDPEPSTQDEPIATSQQRHQSPEKTANAENHKPGWFFHEAGVELTDQDFLSLLEEDPVILEGAMTMSGIPVPTPIRVPDEAPPMLQERHSTAQDFIFLQNFKMPLLELAKELHVFRQRPAPLSPVELQPPPAVAAVCVQPALKLPFQPAPIPQPSPIGTDGNQPVPETADADEDQGHSKDIPRTAHGETHGETESTDQVDVAVADGIAVGPDLELANALASLNDLV
ncbi:hypothetical protein BV898_02294 [Hypsibius exemplaris]|uniref:Myb-like domain-containing protein n=1 Tax=Hypsibius exemplaris TaxID=2072580 RepID=A0A1W0X8U9_HYPEX|nr:hypothetical protein BV898_02294 [Hypsibius exemplaris]